MIFTLYIVVILVLLCVLVMSLLRLKKSISAQVEMAKIIAKQAELRDIKLYSIIKEIDRLAKEYSALNSLETILEYQSLKSLVIELSEDLPISERDYIGSGLSQGSEFARLRFMRKIFRKAINHSFERKSKYA